MDTEENKPAATPAGATPVMDIQPPQPATPTANPISTEPMIGGPAVDPAASPVPVSEPIPEAAPAPESAATPAPIAEALSGTEPVDAPADLSAAAPSSVITPNMGGDAAPTPVPAAQPGKAKPPKKHGAPVAAVVVAIIIALGLIGVAVFAYMKSHKHTPAPATTAAPAAPAAVSATDVDNAGKTVDSNLQKADDAKDFPTTDLSDTSLSLQ